MRVILLKTEQRPSGKVLKAGSNMDVTLNYGASLLYAKRIAAEIPQWIDGRFYLQGELSDKMKELQRPPIGGAQKDVTLEEYKKWKEKQSKKVTKKT